MKKYMQVYHSIKQEITDELLKYGEKLPSKRVAADRFRVSVVSVEHAYELLEAEGYVEARERSGYFVSFRRSDYFASEGESVKTTPVIRTDDVYEGMSFDQMAKCTRSVLSEYGDLLLKKPDNQGVVELRTAIRDYLRLNRSISVEIDQIVVGAGAEYLYGLIAQMLGDRHYGIESPSYPQIERVYRSHNVKYELLAIGSNGIRSEALESTEADVLHITPYRSFPTGVCADASKKAEYIKWAKERNGYLIEDDYESEFSLQGNISETLFASDRDDRVIYVNTFTRTISPSIRVGYMILPRRLVPLFREQLGKCSCTVPTLEQYIIATLMRNGSFVKHINRVRRMRREKNAPSR